MGTSMLETSPISITFQTLPPTYNQVVEVNFESLKFREHIHSGREVLWICFAKTPPWGCHYFIELKNLWTLVFRRFSCTFESWAYVLLWITCEKGKIKQRGRGKKAWNENSHSFLYLLHIVLLTGKSLCSHVWDLVLKVNTVYCSTNSDWLCLQGIGSNLGIILALIAVLRSFSGIIVTVLVSFPLI